MATTDPNNYFGDEKADLQLGSCSVIIPRAHAQGEIERPGRIESIILGENVKKHIVIESITDLNRDRFLNRIGQLLTVSPEKSAMVFVHWFTTQLLLTLLGGLLKLPGTFRLPVSLRSIAWPSGGRPWTI